MEQPEETQVKEVTDNDKLRYSYLSEIQQMMYVFGEKGDPLPDTVKLIEDIVRAQVIELIVMASKLATRRGTKIITPEDVIFLIRKDRAKVNRLRTFLAWKDVRKNTREGGGAEDLEMIEEQDKPQMKKLKIKLPWELISGLTDVIDEDLDQDEDSLEAHKESIQRLKEADEVTRHMTRDEYVFYSECRQASFTYRKSKKFRDWCYMSSYVENKSNDDLIDIMGFLTFEMVGTLTELAIQSKYQSQALTKFKAINARSLNDHPYLNHIDQQPKSLFGPPKGLNDPLECKDIQEAFRTLQSSKKLPLRNFRSGLSRSRVALI